MDLTPEQKSRISTWAREGLDLSEIHSRINKDLGVTMTYLNARMLVAELELHLDDKEKPDTPGSGDSLDPPPDQEIIGDTPPADGGVSVTMDTVAPPHAMASGKVTFSDGENATWYLDEMGRLGLDSTTPSYQPSKEDLLEFQKKLQRLARGM